MDELEVHLRDEIERQREAGLDGQNAFEISVRGIGRPQNLKNEFKKIERNIMKKTAIIVLAILAVLFGPGMILPALAKHRNMGVWNFDIVWPIVVGSIITVAGISATVFGFKKRKA
ncbi:MAG TPA: hypothetical protein VFV23_13940 [Verrucomicrobiae bacterium]|nr:hypothetical protein [Verrucomicrobiae bacterium]